MDNDKGQPMMLCNESHEEHLCYIVSQGFYLAEEQEYRALLRNPRFRCSHCGRQAHNDVNLCVPVDIP
jgi:hypothetical protein